MENIIEAELYLPTMIPHKIFRHIVELPNSKTFFELKLLDVGAINSSLFSFKHHLFSYSGKAHLYFCKNATSKLANS